MRVRDSLVGVGLDFKEGSDCLDEADWDIIPTIRLDQRERPTN